MTTGGQLHVETVCAPGDHAEQHGAEPAAAGVGVLFQDAVEGVQHPDRMVVADGGGPQRVSGQRRQRGCGNALSAHVAQEEAVPLPGQREQVVEVAADLTGRWAVVVGGRLQAGRWGQRRREKRALQGLGETHGAAALILGASALGKEFALVGAAVGGVVGDDADQLGTSLGVGLDVRGEQDGKPPAVGRDEVDRDAAEYAGRQQHWRKVGFVVDAATGGEQPREGGADQCVVVPPQPRRKRLVDGPDLPVGRGDDVTARRVVERVAQRVGLCRHAGAANAAMAAAVASGALSCGQWPVASIVTRSLPAMCSWVYAPTDRGAKVS